MCPRLRSLEWRRRAKAPIHLHRCEYATLQQSQAICKPKSGCGRSSCELGGRLYDSIVRLQPDDSRHHAGGGSGCCQRRCGCREITQASRHYSGAGGGCCSCATRRGRRRGRRRRGRADGGDADGGDAEGQQRRFIWHTYIERGDSSPERRAPGANSINTERAREQNERYSSPASNIVTVTFRTRRILRTAVHRLS